MADDIIDSIIKKIDNTLPRYDAVDGLDEHCQEAIVLEKDKSGDVVRYDELIKFLKDLKDNPTGE